MTSDELKALSDAATQGQWCAGGGSLGEAFVFVKSWLGIRMNFTAICNDAKVFDERAYNAAYIAELVNMHRSGDLIHRDDLDAQLSQARAEGAEAMRERCAAVSDKVYSESVDLALDGLPSHARRRESMASAAESIRTRIRALPTQEQDDAS